MYNLLPQYVRTTSRIMVFVDGENFAIRYKRILEDKPIPNHVKFQPNVYVWSSQLDNLLLHYEVIRKYYYTSVQGDALKIESVIDKLKDVGIEVPRVFKKSGVGLQRE